MFVFRSSSIKVTYIFARKTSFCIIYINWATLIWTFTLTQILAKIVSQNLIVNCIHLHNTGNFWFNMFQENNSMAQKI